MLSAMTPCREYRGALNRDGYGLRHRRRRFKSKLVHRQIMEMAGVDIEGKVVYHRCDTPACFRFDHLVVGTQADNMRDKAEKGRARNQHTKEK